MKKIFNSIIVLMILAALFLTSCGSAPKSNDNTLKVLASTTFLADITQNIAGDRAKVKSLLPIGADPHSYQAAPCGCGEDIRKRFADFERFGIRTLYRDVAGKCRGAERMIVEAHRQV